jgi:hypothetical protein
MPPGRRLIGRSEPNVFAEWVTGQQDLKILPLCSIHFAKFGVLTQITDINSIAGFITECESLISEPYRTFVTGGPSHVALISREGTVSQNFHSEPERRK